jgi:organic radical activating enzyme
MNNPKIINIIPRENIKASSDIRSYDQANEISPTFCAAKWYMTTIHLAHGETHSCYHPWTHKIPLEEVKKDSGAIHNTEYKKSQRKLMLNGERPKECQYCWNMEDLGHISDRIIRNDEKWTKYDLSNFKNMTGDEDVYPRHVELSFSTTCNLKCSYCNPGVSSKWLEEIQKYGGYNTSTKFNNFGLKGQALPYIKESDDNPYIDAFWDYLPKMYPHVKVLRVTGGEPLMSKHTFKLLDYVKTHENKNLEMVVNSNLCVPDVLVDKILEVAIDIEKAKVIHNFKLFLSIDATGKQAEYGRNGLNWEQFKRNVYKYLNTVDNCRIGFTVTFNIFSVPDFSNLIKFFHELRKEFHPQGKMVTYDNPYLRYPPHQCINILPNEFVKYLKETEVYMEQYKGKSDGFSQLEIDKVKRLQAFMLHKDALTDEQLNTYRKDFVIFVDEHDRRRDTNFLETFPEYEEFYKLCQGLK